MASSLRGILILVSCWALSAPVAAQRDCVSYPSEDLAELRQRYGWGALYVPYGPLAEIHRIATTPGRATTFSQLTVGPGFSVFSSFVMQTRSLAARVAVLHLDLCHLRAGFIPPEAESAFLTPLNWSPHQVMDAARWYDSFLQFNSTIFAAFSLIQRNDALSADSTVEAASDAWAALARAATSPFVSPNRLATLSSEFRSWIARDPDRLEVIEYSNPQIYTDIVRFRDSYDRLHYDGLLRDAFESESLQRPHHIQRRLDLAPENNWQLDGSIEDHMSPLSLPEHLSPQIFHDDTSRLEIERLLREAIVPGGGNF